MSGYLFFSKTGIKEVDDIADILEEAGNMYHHTSQWLDEGYDGEEPYLKKIQKKLEECANKIKQSNYGLYSNK